MHTQFFALIFFLLFLSTNSLIAQEKTSFAFEGKNLHEQYQFLKNNLNSLNDVASYIAVFSKNALQEKDSNFIAKSYYLKYRLYRKAKSYAEAHLAIDNAIATANLSKQDSLLGTFYHAKGATFYIQSNYIDALNYYLQAHEIVRSNGSLNDRLTLEFDIATLKLKGKKTEEALTAFNRIIHSYDSLLRTNTAPQFLQVRFIKMLNNTAKTYTEEGMFEKALQLYAKSLKLSENVGFLSGKCIAIGGKGNVFTAQKKYSDAIKVLNEALHIATENDELQLITPFLLLDKGKCLFGLKKYGEALDSLQMVDELIQAKNLSFIALDETYELLAKTYAKLENFEKATEVYDQYIKRTQLTSEKQFQLYRTIFEGYDLKNAEFRATQAEKTSVLFKSYFSQAVVIALILIGIVFTLFVFYRKQQKNKLAKFNTVLQKLKAQQKSAAKTNTSKFVLSDEKAQKILDKLESLESQHFFLDKKYNLATLAKKCKTNSSYLSKVINQYKGKTFSEYMADLRINYVLKSLKSDKKLRAYTIQSIAEEIGFNKSESFSKAFKKRTGLNPSYYIKNLEDV